MREGGHQPRAPQPQDEGDDQPDASRLHKEPAHQGCSQDAAREGPLHKRGDVEVRIQQPHDFLYHVQENVRPEPERLQEGSGGRGVKKSEALTSGAYIKKAWKDLFLNMKCTIFAKVSITNLVKPSLCLSRRNRKSSC